MDRDILMLILGSTLTLFVASIIAVRQLSRDKKSKARRAVTKLRFEQNQRDVERWREGHDYESQAV